MLAVLVDDQLCYFSNLVGQLQNSRVGKVGWCGGGINAQCSPILPFWPISRLHKIID